MWPSAARVRSLAMLAIMTLKKAMILGYGCSFMGVDFGTPAVVRAGCTAWGLNFIVFFSGDFELICNSSFFSVKNASKICVVESSRPVPCLISPNP